MLSRVDADEDLLNLRIECDNAPLGDAEPLAAVAARLTPFFAPPVVFTANCSNCTTAANISSMGLGQRRYISPDVAIAAPRSSYVIEVSCAEYRANMVINHDMIASAHVPSRPGAFI